MITMNPNSTSTGPVTITVKTAGGACGTATLNVTPGVIADYQAGQARYFADAGASTFNGRNAEPEGGAPTGCVVCHVAAGVSADAGHAGLGFNDIAHTPEQAGGFSDETLLGIIQNGTVPGWSTDAGASADAGYFDETIIPYRFWNRFHRWALTPQEQKGVILYLRGLTPTAQNGSADFGGHGGPPPDGGYGHHHGSGSGSGFGGS